MKFFHVVFVLLVILCITVNGLKTNVRDGGDCGDDVHWTLSNGVLTISGSGEMSNFSYGSSPWSGSTITSVVIEDGVTSIGCYAFYYCSNLKSVAIPDGVKSIGNFSFYYCTSLETVVIPDSVKSIGRYAFDGCSNLTTINIPYGVKVIEFDTFMGCKSLNNITIPSSVETIEYGAFQDCISLTEIVIPPSVTFIDEYAFYSCEKLTNLTFSYGLVTIERFAFGRCTGLSSVTIPGSVKTIGVRAFSGCSSLMNVFIEDGVETIKESAFYGCNLTSITIPSSVTTIEQYGIYECQNLESVFYQGSEAILTYVFDTMYKLTTICVSPDYNNSKFCNLDITPNDPLCIDFKKQFDHCYEGTYIDGHIQQQKRKNVTDIENQSNGCIEYHCFNDTGIISWSVCNSTNICVKEEQCIDKDTAPDDKKWSVIIEMEEGIKVEELNISAITESITELTGIDSNGFIIGYEVDSNGYIINIIVYIGDEANANLLADSIDKMDKGEGCKYGILCKSRSTRVRAYGDELSTAMNTMINTLMLIFSLLIFFY